MGGTHDEGNRFGFGRGREVKPRATKTDGRLMFLLAIPPQSVAAVFDLLRGLPKEIADGIMVAGCGLDDPAADRQDANDAERKEETDVA